MQIDFRSITALAITAAATIIATGHSIAAGDIVIAESTFDSSMDEWTLRDPIGGLDLSWEPNGGNPDGYLRFDDLSNGLGVAVAPAKFLGDWSSLDGIGRFDFNQTLIATGDNIDSFIAPGVRVTGPGGSAVWRGATPTGTTPWESISISILEANWTVDSGNWNALLADVTDVWMITELVAQTTSNSLRDSSGIDNVRLVNSVPEPGTAMVLALAGVLLVSRRRRRV